MKILAPFYSKFVSLTAVLLIFVACTEDDAGEQEGPFDRQAMLASYADNTVIPAYGVLLSKVDHLSAQAEVLMAEPNQVHLEATQEAWVEAYRAWQGANAFNFGPAGEMGLRKSLIEEIGTFPVSEVKIQTVLETGVFNLNDFNRDARGFLTVEYLLFAPTEPGSSPLGKFDGPHLGNFLLALIVDIQERVADVHQNWTSNYRNSFVNNNGTDVGSSTSQFYNEFVKSFEAIKNFKAGLPLGLRPGQVEAAPNLVEARYSARSREMMELHFNAIVNIWVGRDSQDRDGLGFEDYLQTVVGGPALVESTKAQIDAVRGAFDGVPFDPSFAEQTISQPEAATALHTELQKQTRFFKSDMSSLLGIAITFSSGDGD